MCFVVNVVKYIIIKFGILVCQKKTFGFKQVDLKAFLSYLYFSKTYYFVINYITTVMETVCSIYQGDQDQL